MKPVYRLRLGVRRNYYGWRICKRSAGFSLLEVSVTLFLTVILCSLAMYTAVSIWRADSLAKVRWEHDGMISNVQRVLMADIHGAKEATWANNTLHLVMVDGTPYVITVNGKHQLIEYMPRGGIQVLGDSVDALQAVINGVVVTVKLTWVSGQISTMVFDLLGRRAG